MWARLWYFFPMYIFVIAHIKDILRELCMATVACPSACSQGLVSPYDLPERDRNGFAI